MLARHRISGIALSLGVLAFAAVAGTTQAQAEVITYTIKVLGDTITVATPADATTTSSSLNASELGVLNTDLANAGSAYQFAALGGTSSFPGQATAGDLALSGFILFNQSSFTGSNAALTITESESGFQVPTGVSGHLLSTSHANYSNAGFGTSQSVSGSFNAMNTSTYHLVFESGPDNLTGSASIDILGISAPYTLDNTLAFFLGGGAATDAFDASDAVTVTTTVPEPKLFGPAALAVLLLSLAVRRLYRGKTSAQP